jgi:hypothetical protein
MGQPEGADGPLRPGDESVIDERLQGSGDLQDDGPAAPGKRK